MRESVVYQRIVAESEHRGVQKGFQQGESTLVLRLLTRRFGILPNSMAERIRQLGTIQLESLGEALLDFGQLSEVEDWLARNS